MKSGIVFDKVSFSYQGKTNQINKVSFQIPLGSFYGITGLNGSGKSTLVLLMNGLIPHQIEGILTGNVYVDQVNTKDEPVYYFAKKIGMVFQNPDFMLFNLNVREEIEFGLKNLRLDQHDKKIRQALASVDMEEFIDRDPKTLSFGQKQKICLAATIAQNSSYIILDEPTAMLDYKSSLNLYRLLQKLNSQGKTIVIVEHDINLLKKYADMMMVIDKGEIILSGKTDTVLMQYEKNYNSF
jgi:energy-coupling factor transporter ATP-binding protein EcfA2